MKNVLALSTYVARAAVLVALAVTALLPAGMARAQRHTSPTTSKSVKSVKAAVATAKECDDCKKAGAAKKGVACADATFVTLKLAGLGCEGCAAEVKEKLMDVAGVESADVSAVTQTAVVGVCSKMMPTSEVLKAAVKKAGYSVIAVEKDKPKATTRSATHKHKETARG